MEGLPWWPSVKNPPANAGEMGSVPGPGRSHLLQGTWAHVLGTREVTTVRSPHNATKSSPCLLQLERNCA